MLEIKKLTYKYPGSDFGIRDIDLNIERSKVHALVGENGAGKSTLFFGLLGLIRPDAGEIFLDGEKLNFKKKELWEYRSRVNLVMQNPDKQIFYSNVRDDIAFPLRNLKKPEDYIEAKLVEVAEETGILDLLDRPVHALSYGQKKRVAIAGVLAMEPDYILFDEPTAGLDPGLTASMSKLIRRLAQDGRGVLISSHDMDFIYSISDQASVISKGEIITTGPRAEVFAQGDLLKKAGLVQPTLARLHKECGFPLFENMEDLIKHLKQ